MESNNSNTSDEASNHPEVVDLSQSVTINDASQDQLREHLNNAYTKANASKQQSCSSKVEKESHQKEVNGFMQKALKTDILKNFISQNGTVVKAMFQVCCICHYPPS